jgi:hypothetical protein
MGRRNDWFEELREREEGALGQLGNVLVLLDLVRMRERLSRPTVENIGQAEQLIRSVQQTIKTTFERDISR